MSNVELVLEPITTGRVIEVLDKVKPSAKNVSRRYHAWQKEFEAC